MGKGVDMKKFSGSMLLSVFTMLLIALIICDAKNLFAASLNHEITFKNNCEQTIWVGQAGTSGDGWEMKGKSQVIKNIPLGFSGRWWPRTGCSFDPQTNKCPSEGINCCDTGGCLSEQKYFGLKCITGGEAPVSLFEVTFDAPSPFGLYDTLDLSLVDGFTVPMLMEPKKGTYNDTPDPGMDPSKWCKAKGWTKNPTCPASLKDPNKDICWGPCKYYTNIKKVNSGKNKANICCDNTNVDYPPSPSKQCQKDDFIGGYGCSPIGPGRDEQKCFASTPGKHGYWGAIVDTIWPDINKSVEYITNVNRDVPGVYAWQFDDLNSTYICRKTGGHVDYIITFCPQR